MKLFYGAEKFNKKKSLFHFYLKEIVLTSPSNFNKANKAYFHFDTSIYIYIHKKERVK